MQSEHKKLSRGIFVGMIFLVSYVSTIIGLFFTNSLLIPLISFIVLFISIYFFAIDLYQYPKRYFLRILLGIATVVELWILPGTTRHLYVEVIVYNLTIILFFFFLFRQLRNSLSFSAFAYFTEGGYTIAALLTIFFSVVMLGKYSQIPFSCEDIDNFSTQLVEAPIEILDSSKQSIKNVRTTLFPSSELTQETVIVDLGDIQWNKSEVELFFEKSRDFLQTQAVELQGSVSKNSCEFVMTTLKKIQINEGFQLAVIVLMYFLLIGIFKILLWMISIIGFLIFLVLKPWKLYTYEKKEIQKESIR